MSATNRGAERVESDLYPTPLAAFRPLLPLIKQLGVPVWEPACGDGRLITYMRDEGGMQAFGDDLRNGYDFLKSEAHHDCIVTNPPFSIALDFCRHALAHANNVFMLLRLGFLASEDRRPFWQAHPPRALFILCKRPGFIMSCKCPLKECKHAWTLPIESVRPRQCVKCGFHQVKISTSDSADYAWVHWGSRITPGIHHL